MADRTQVILVFVFLLQDDIATRDLDFGILQEILDLVVVDSAVGDDVSEFLVVVFMPEDERVVLGNVEDIGKSIERVDAMAIVGGLARALQLIADRDLELGAVDVLEDEASAAGDADKVKLLPSLQQHFDFLLLQLLCFLFVRLRHTTINIIRSSRPLLEYIKDTIPIVQQELLSPQIVPDGAPGQPKYECLIDSYRSN